MRRDNLKVNEVQWVCQQCGEQFGKGVGNGKKQVLVSTWHTGACDICGYDKAVTEQRDFGYIDQYKLDHY